MASILNTAAQRLNANTAGRTTTHTEPSPGAPVAATATEVFHNTIATATGALDSIFRQEPVAPPIASTATPAQGGSAGPHGGRVPSVVSGILGANPGGSPGPTTGTPARAVQLPTISPTSVRYDVTTAAGKARQTAAHTIATIRRRLGV